MRKNYLAAVLVCPALLLPACSKQETVGLYHIGIVQIVEAALLDDARRGVIDALREEGFIDVSNIRISFKSAQGDLSTISIIIKELVSS